MKRERLSAEKTRPLSVSERKALIADIEKTADPKVKKGLALIDHREPSSMERAIANSLEGRAEKALARQRSKKAA